MKTRTFPNGLVVKYRKSAVIFENQNGKQPKESRFDYDFTPDEFRDFVKYIQEVANQSWKNITPKEATSMASDYDEYYDRRYDDNGYLTITPTGIRIDAPYWSTDTLYQFNKPKIQTFIYDALKHPFMKKEC